MSAHLPGADRAGGRCAARGPPATAGTLVLVTEDEPALFKIIGRHLDRHPIARQRLDAVLFHLAGGVGNDLVSGIELHAITCVGGDFGDQSFELDQLFFSHGFLQIDRRLAWSLGTIGSSIGASFAMQEGNALHPVRLAAALRRRACRLVPIGAMTAGLRTAHTTTTTAAAARPLTLRL